MFARSSAVYGAIIATVLGVKATTATAGAGSACAGDCNGDGRVVVSELITSVKINLGRAQLDACLAVDGDSSGSAEINEIVQAVGQALRGCASTGAVFIIRA